MIDRRYGRNWIECIVINISGTILARVIFFCLFIFSPLVLLANKCYFGRWLWDATDLRSANEVNIDNDNKDFLDN